jgi:hypothetical protein
MKTIDVVGKVGEVAGQAAKAVANAVFGRRPARPRNAAAAEELRRRAEINARGAALRATLPGAGGGRQSWIGDTGDWLRRRR